MEKNQILSHEQIQHKIRRIAYQIYENNVTESRLFIGGIMPNGYAFAERIKGVLDQISDIKSILFEVYIDKENHSKTNISINEKEYRDQSVVLVDDVLNTGETLIFGVKHLLNVPLKQFKTAVLINRNHKKYPVKADFKGLSLSTSANEHVRVVLHEGKDGVFLE